VTIQLKAVEQYMSFPEVLTSYAAQGEREGDSQV